MNDAGGPREVLHAAYPRITSKVKSADIEVIDGKISLTVGSYAAVLSKSSFETPSGTFDSSGVKLKGQIKLG